MNATPGMVSGAAGLLAFVAALGGLVGGIPGQSAGDIAGGACVGAAGAVLCFGIPALLVGAFFGGLLGSLDWTRRPAPARLGNLGTIATWMVVIAVFGVLLAAYRSLHPGDP